MKRTEAQAIVDKKYLTRAAVLEWLDTANGVAVFGMIEKDELATVEAPFYITVDDAGAVTEHPAPMVSDEWYNQSTFGHLEGKYKFYAKKGIFD